MKYWLIALWQMIHWPARKTIKNKTIIGETVVLDFLVLEGCELHNCKVVYMGLGKVTLSNGSFIGCTYQFVGPAGKALQFMKVFGELSPDLILRTFPFLKGVKKPS